jgi:transcriptional regulator with XRE-family HTH domain
MITGRDVREARGRAGLTQKALATALGASLRTVNAWENGREIDPVHYAKLYDVLQLSPDRSVTRSPSGEAKSSDLQLIADITAELAAVQQNVARLAARLADLNAGRDEQSESQVDNESKGTVSTTGLDEAVSPRKAAGPGGRSDIDTGVVGSLEPRGTRNGAQDNPGLLPTDRDPPHWRDTAHG